MDRNGCDVTLAGAKKYRFLDVPIAVNLLLANPSSNRVLRVGWILLSDFRSNPGSLACQLNAFKGIGSAFWEVDIENVPDR